MQRSKFSLVVSASMAIAVIICIGGIALNQSATAQRPHDEHREAEEIERQIERLHEELERLRDEHHFESGNDDQHEIEEEFDEEAWHEEHERHDDHWHEIEQHRFHLETERLQLEVMAMRMEVNQRIVESVSTPEQTSALMLQQLGPLIEHDTPHAIELLEQAREQANDAAVRRLLEVKLVEIYLRTEQHDKAMPIAKRLLSGAPD